ncbi:hypothetical protein [Simonsiella muelleri]|uniref:Uncharacterized protein n=2 Tax=Simonsiella TaxID=71 RepID=V9HMS5_9NEIS|nr:hypothetical protein [Simonsiella muelleri]AUX60793.1 hypothetical protein BWP33_02430 [Simonsiella muelleri ATCC 29453]EFG31634.2 hypothetical protein HMPREF9021_00029 [Simonsiella muelleri ATCC 29453]
MSGDFNPDSNFKIIVLGIALVLFGATAYLGYRFIVEAERSASGINQEPSFNKGKDLDFSHFQDSIPLPSNHQIRMAINHDGTSMGDDLEIKAGEFAYQYSQPVIRIALHNRGGFAISSAAVSLSLFLDDAKEAVANAVGVPILFNKPLLPEEDTVVSVPVSGDLWQNENVRRASSRRVLVQIISVSNGDNENAEYTQTSQGVYLTQTGNDWRVAADTTPSNRVASTVSSSAPPPDFADPTAGMNLTIPQPIPAIPIEPVTDLKIDKIDDNTDDLFYSNQLNNDAFRQPENNSPSSDSLPEQTGVISYEFKEFKK